MLAVVTGPVRSGKSAVALSLAMQTGAPIVIAVGGRGDDEEMLRRIARHQADRSADVSVVEAGPGAAWVAEVPRNACLLVDCLGTVLGPAVIDALGAEEGLISADAEHTVEAAAQALVDALATRAGHTVVVTNEVGWGVVPASAAGRLFRDVLGRATRGLVDAADAAWLVVGGRCVELTGLPTEARWPE
jgi:adenosylcobinamide kinase/adenosylcobinamide-phosphate guanylyltransferase